MPEAPAQPDKVAACLAGPGQARALQGLLTAVQACPANTEGEGKGMHALQAGAKHGLGTYTWPNGATYSGEWQAGCMHGVGTFEGPDGTTYQARL